MNSHNLWSNTNTKDVLVPYAEGLACDNFDKREYYNVHRSTEFCWYVLNKEAGTIPPNEDIANNIKFDRVRIVLLDDNQFMSCSCGYVQRYLIPCCHVCAVLEDIKYYDPSLFHIRWHKSFNYFYGNSFSPNIAPRTNDILNRVLDDTRATSYSDSGKYKGVPLMNSNFIKDLPVFVHERLDKNIEEHSIIDLMIKILEHTNTHGPVLKDSIQLCDQTSNDESNTDCIFINNGDESDDNIDGCTAHFGGSSQTETQLSTARLAIDNAAPMNEVIQTSSYYKLALPLFEDMMNSCKTIEQFKKDCETLERRHYEHIAENRGPQQNNTTQHTYLFGQNDTKQRREARQKFPYEKRQEHKR